ncbi:MAG TPA: class I SAM-dependent methyltransferase [Longimicrobiales bacterium]|nr:class I SAM-dependent methyltransferase [Longimicrobiales bacterium]
MRGHWESVYRTKQAEAVSWYQPRSGLSLGLIREALPDRDGRILDVGGGASRLAGDLWSAGYREVVVLDVVAEALSQARSRLSGSAPGVRWIVADALALPLASGSVALWHDRACFHFLTEDADRALYLAEVHRVVRPGGWVLVATFAADGPERCSDLPVRRYGPEELHAAFAPAFEPVRSEREVHRTPSGGEQPFTYALCRRGDEKSFRGAEVRM